MGFLNGHAWFEMNFKRQKQKMASNISAKRAFSLIEISIVLVILGLLVGGVLVGQNLIRAAEVRSVATELHTYRTAVTVFQDEYMALPGDIDNATSYWGAAGCTATAGTGTETCNGNGDDRVLRTVFTAGQYNEHYMFWQHLANAGLIEGQYTGMAGPDSATHSIKGVNIPTSKLPNAGWGVAAWSTPAGHPTVLGPMPLGNYFNMTSYVGESVLTPAEAFKIDKKIDDGQGGRGMVIATNWDNGCLTATASDDFDAAYNLADRTLQCSLYFRDLF